MVTILAGAGTFGLTSLIVLPQLPLHDLGACLGVLFWLVPPIIVLCIVPKKWDEMIKARENARWAAEEEARRIRATEEHALYEAQRAAEREAELARQAADRHRNQQQNLMNLAAALVATSVKLVHELPELARQATEALNRAEEEFAERGKVRKGSELTIDTRVARNGKRKVESSAKSKPPGK